MKHFYQSIIGLALLWLLSGCGKFIPTEIENGELLGVIPIQHNRGSYQVSRKIHANREDIFRQARRWAAFHVPNPSQVLAISDNLMGDIITYGGIAGGPIVGIRGQPLYLPNLEYSISIECYENAYRVTLTNFVMYGAPSAHPIELRHTTLRRKKATMIYRELDRRSVNILESIDEFISSELKTVLN